MYKKVSSLLVAIPFSHFILRIHAIAQQECTPSRSDPYSYNVFHSVLGPLDPFNHPSRRAQRPSESNWHLQIYKVCTCLDRMPESDIGRLGGQKENLKEYKV